MGEHLGGSRPYIDALGVLGFALPPCPSKPQDNGATTKDQSRGKHWQPKAFARVSKNPGGGLELLPRLTTGGHSGLG